MATVEFFVNTDNTTAGNGLTRGDSGTYWAVSFDAGGSAEPTVDTDTVSFSTSGYTGTLRKIILLSGTWAGSNAAGILIFQDATRTGSAPTDGETITIGSQSATTNITGTASSFWGNTNSDAAAYKTMLGWRDGTGGYTDTSSDDVKVFFSGTTADNDGQDGAGTDLQLTSATLMSFNTLLLQGDDDESIEGQDGVAATVTDGWYQSYNLDVSTSHYRRVMTTGFGYCIEIQVDNVKVRGLQADSDTSTGHPLGVTTVTSPTNIIVEACRFDMGHTSGAALFWLVSTGGAGCIIRNNIIVNYEGVGVSDGCINVTNNITGPVIVNNWFQGNGTPRLIEDGNGTTERDISNNVFVDHNGDEVRNSTSTITNADDNATDDTSMLAKINVGAQTSIVATTDYVSATDLRPISGGKLHGNADTISPAGYDPKGVSRSDSNIGPFSDVFTASGLGIAIAAYHYNHNVGSNL